MIRISQEQRRKQTRDAVLSAALQVLTATGYSAFSVVKVAKCAGVTRGALEHYFPSKDDLLIGVCQFVIDRALQHARTRARKQISDADAVKKFLSDCQSFFFGETYRGMIELAIAVKGNPKLAAIHDQIVTRGRAELNRPWRQVLVSAGYSEAKVRTFIDLTQNLFRGLFLTTTWLPHKPDSTALLNAWAKAAPAILGQKRKTLK